MTRPIHQKLSRRALLQAAAALGVTGAVAGLPARRALAQASPRLPARLLFVVAGAGGASITDSFLPVTDTEAGAAAATLAVQPSSLVETVNGLRCVGKKNSNVGGLPVGGDFLQRTFLTKHGADTVVMTVESTSVNHLVGQKRFVTGAGINAGRTIMEAHASTHGLLLPLPNCNLADGGYLEPGDDVTLDARARPEAIADPRTFPLATDGIRGIADAPDAALVRRARRIRDTLDDASPFGHTFKDAPLRQRILDSRRSFMAEVEARDLITKLMLVQDDPTRFPLTAAGLESSPDGARVREKFPKLVSDELEAQAAMAFMLAKTGVSSAITIAPSFSPVLNGATLENPPLAFDFSHNDHPATQNAMWSRLLRVVDGLVDLLKAEPDGEGGTLWDRSLVYVATDFGREKIRPTNASAFGTGHHLNNGVVMVSPLLRGGRVYGGIDPTTLLTHGFDPTTGEPAPGTVMREGDVYAVVAGALGVDYAGRRSFPALVRG
jgi:uncharacterized protein (DUF1501 family)